LSRHLSNTWWLLALCGVLDAMHATMNLLMLNPSVTLRRFGPPAAVWDMGMLALAAGACAVAAGLWVGGKDNSWLLSLHGLALGAFGTIAVSPLVRGPLSFRPVSLLFLAMAASLAAFALGTARSEARGTAERRFLKAAGATLIGFAFSFIAVGFRLVRLEPPQAFFVWMSSYFALCALFFLWLAVRTAGEAWAAPGNYAVTGPSSR
jgi:hypothetical protein